MKANTAISIWHLETCSHLRSPCKYLWEKCPWLYDMHFYLPNLSTGFEFPSWDKSIGFAWGCKSFERVHKYCALLHPVIFMKIFQVIMAFGSLFYLRWQNWGTKWTNTQVTKHPDEVEDSCPPEVRLTQHDTFHQRNPWNQKIDFLNKYIKSLKKKNNQGHARLAGCVKTIKNKN